MRIAINCRSFSKKNYAGIGRYAYNLVRSLSEIDRENEYWLYIRKSLFDPSRQIPRIPPKNFIVKRDRFNQGIEKVLRNTDIYHSPSPDFIPSSKAKIIVTVHDLIYKTYPEGHTEATRATTDEQLQDTVKRADKIICCSQSTINDLKESFDVDEDRLRLIYQGVDKNVFYPLNAQEREQAHASLKKKGIDRPFLLFVGTIEPRKNLQNLLKAFSSLRKSAKFDGKMVIIGMKGWMTEGIEDTVKTLKLKEDLIFPGYLTDDELREFYNLASVFVFPSFYEGFGFPIVEAFSCGAAVVTSNVSSCPEIAGDGALTIDPHSPEEIAEAITCILEDKNLRELLKEKALKRAKVFSFQNTAEQTLEVYEQVYNS